MDEWVVGIGFRRKYNIVPSYCALFFLADFLNPDLNGFEGWMDKKMIFNGLEANSFHNHFALAKFFNALQSMLHFRCVPD